MPVSPVLFSSVTDEWATPQDFFDALDKEFRFTLDVCASPDKAKCPRFYTRGDDGLRQPWDGTCWMNPPYGRDIGRWVCKARLSAQQGATVVCLLPARTDTQWFHREVLPHAAEVRFVEGRLRFGEGSDNAPFPSIVVVFKPGRQLLKASGYSTVPEQLCFDLAA
jgi:phage N-6-adenine-methyltransferase